MVLRPQGLLPERRRKLELTAAIPAEDQLARAAARHGAVGTEPERASDERRRVAAAAGRTDGRRAPPSWSRTRVTKRFGGLVAVSDVVVRHPGRGRSSR